MTGFLHSTLADAEAYRAASIERGRKSGGSTVRVYATTAAMYAARGGDTRTDGGKIADSVRELWARMKDDAVSTFRTAAEIEPMEGFIPW